MSTPKNKKPPKKLFVAYFGPIDWDASFKRRLVLEMRDADDPRPETVAIHEYVRVEKRLPPSKDDADQMFYRVQIPPHGGIALLTRNEIYRLQHQLEKIIGSR